MLRMMVQKRRRPSPCQAFRSQTPKESARLLHMRRHAWVMYCMPWCDNQIHKGNDEIRQCDSRVCDHPQFGKRCEAPDQVGPPISYMEEHGVFKPDGVSTNNPMGLCWFYHMSPEKANVLVGLKSAECARRIHRLIEIAKRIGRQLMVVVFEGESVSPWCLLGDLHSRLALSRFTIHTPEEAKIGISICMYCCPICARMSLRTTLLSLITS